MISVIIPAYNSERTIEACLKSLLRQSFPKKQYEITVVDDGSTDRTTELVSRYPVKLLKQKHQGPAAARNFGAKRAKGKILLFTDADCVPDKNWIKNMVEPFEDNQIIGVSGTYRTLNKNKLLARFVGYEIEERHKKLSNQKFIDFIGTFSAGYRKNTFFKFGGFDSKFVMASAEDPDLSFNISKSGGKMVFQPKAFVYHNHPETLWKFLKQKFWRGYWRVPLYKKHKQKMFRHSYTPKSLFLEEALIVPFLLAVMLLIASTLGLISLSLLKIVSNIFILTGLALLAMTSGIYLGIIFSSSWKVFKRDKIVGLFSSLIIILRDLFTGIGIVCGMLFGKR